MWNPSFDVTPGRLITGIITERGMVPKKPPPPAADGTVSEPSFNVREFMWHQVWTEIGALRAAARVRRATVETSRPSVSFAKGSLGG